MARKNWWIVVAALAVVAVGSAGANSDATRAFCKRTSSKVKPYVRVLGNTARLKAADIYPVPRGGCPRTVLTATTGGTVLPVALTGEAEASPADPVGTGEATVRARLGQGQVCYRLSTSNLSGTVAAHIHRGVSGVAGPVVVALRTPTTGASSGCTTASRSVVKALLKAPAAYYVNVHTAEFPGGAIRGQLRGTSTSSFGWIVAINLVGSSEPNARGTAVVRIRKDAGQVCYRLHAENITLPATAAHIHRGAANANGPVVVPFTPPGASGNSASCTGATAALIDEIVANPAGFYVNVHTQEHPAGAMRGQLG
jgi:hypothetical protein